MFNPSLLKIIEERPWRWTTEPTYNPDGSEATPGVKSAPLGGVFIMLSDELVDTLADGLTAAEKTELRGWVDRRTEEECATWHVPLWAGETSAVFLRIPAAVWNNPTGNPPAKVRRYFAHLWRQATEPS